MTKFKTQIQLGTQTHTVESDNFEEYLEFVGYLNVLAQTTEDRNAVLYAETRGGYDYKGWLDIDTGHKLDFGESLNPAEKSRRFFAYSPHSDSYKGYVDGRGKPQPAKRQAAPAQEQPAQEQTAPTSEQRLDAMQKYLEDAEAGGFLEKAINQCKSKVDTFSGNHKRRAAGVLERFQAKLYTALPAAPGDDLPF